MLEHELRSWAAMLGGPSRVRVRDDLPRADFEFPCGWHIEMIVIVSKWLHADQPSWVIGAHMRIRHMRKIP